MKKHLDGTKNESQFFCSQQIFFDNPRFHQFNFAWGYKWTMTKSLRGGGQKSP